MNSPQTDQKPGAELGEQTLADMDPGSMDAAKAGEKSTGKDRRKALRERVAEKAARQAAVRFDQACELAIEMRHKRGCPEEDALPGEADRRVEFYTATKPRTEDSPKEELLVVRCIECGEEETAPDESEKRQ